MTTMDEISRKVHSLFKTARDLWERRRFSPFHKLIGLAVATSIVALSMERWTLLIVLIVCVTALAYFTDKALSAAWLASPDPLARFLEGWEQFRETVTLAYCRLLNTERVTETQELRARSESIASTHIPDLDIDLDSTGPGSSFHKNIRLELNSIVLLITRDFVQFWYEKFSYNSQFLKDTRQFLFRGFHNVVYRLSRLGPHRTSAKFIQAYRKHLSSFQTAQNLMDNQEQNHESCQKTQHNAKTKLKRLESVDEAFQSKFKFHPALKSTDAERQYLRSVTKIILLCSCSHDVVSAHSVQLFLIEILAMNVLLPVVEMLSSPDRLYEIFIRLTYDDNNVMLNENTIKELIGAEVKRMQLKKASIQPGLAPFMTQTTAHIAENKDTCGACVDQTGSSHHLQQVFSHGAGDGCQSQSSIKSSEITTSSKDHHQKSKACDVSTSGANTPDESRNPVTAARNGSLNMTRTVNDTDSDAGAASPAPDEKGRTESQDLGGGECEIGMQQCESGQVLKPSEADDQSDADVHAAHTDSQPEKTGELHAEGTAATVVGFQSVSAQSNHVYGEMVATNLPFPAVKPKLQAFKDLFKSKKSKQQGEARPDSTLDKDQDADGQKSPTNGKSTTDSILPNLKLKSLRLSPLLSRSSRLVNSGNSDNLSTVSKDGKKVSDLESEKQTPSPLPTPSPSQPTKGGPLSFFRFRKPTLEFRKSSPPAVEVQPVDSPPIETSAADDSTAAADKASSLSLMVPSVQVTDENGKDGRRSSSSSEVSSASSHRTQSVSISSCAEMSPVDLETAPHDLRTPLFFSPGDDVEEGEEAEGMEGEDVVVVPQDSSHIFQDISIPSTMTCQEYRSNMQFTVYQIEYEALHFSETGIPVLKTGTAKRRYREFVNLMSRLEDNSAYKRLLKDVKGPKRWLTLPFKNMDKENVAGRQKALEQFLKSLIDVEAVCNGPEMREFLAYEGDSHIAFVKKATEINVPRIDKMLARTVSGVFDKLKSLPNLPQEMMSGIRGRDCPVERKESTGVETDIDSISVDTVFAPDMSLDNMLRDISEKYTHDIQTQGHPEPTPSSPTSQLLKDVGSNLSQQILLHVPRVEGDGAECPDDGKEVGVGLPGPGQLLMFDAVIDLVVQLLVGRHHWLCHERVVAAVRNTLGRTIDRWARESVSSLTTEERCLYYIRLLRETVWPGGKFMSSKTEEKTVEEKEATRAVAKRLLLDFFPGAAWIAVGADSLECVVDQVLESLQYTKLNKHFLYSTIDTLLESLFPEVTDPQFQSQLLL